MCLDAGVPVHGSVLERIRRCGLVGGGVSLGVGFPLKTQRLVLLSACSPCDVGVGQDVSSQLLLQRHTCLHATVLLTIMTMD